MAYIHRISTFVFCILISFLSLERGLAQEVISNHKWLTIKDGLNFRKVNTINQDTTGLIWVGTDLGLQFYDGHQFLNYTYRGKGDQFKAINDIEKSPQGDMYLSTTNGVLKFNSMEGAFYHLDFDRVDSRPDIRKLIFVGEKTLYAVGATRIYVFRENRFQPTERFPFTADIGFKNPFQYSEMVDQEKLLIVFSQFTILYDTKDDRLLKFKQRTQSRHPISIGDSIKIISQQGLEFDKLTFEFKESILSIPDFLIQNTVLLGDQTLLHNTKSGRLLLYKGTEFSSELDIQGPNGYRITDHLEDQNGDHFFATNYGIIFLSISRSNFEILSKDAESVGKFSNGVRKIIITERGDLMFSQGLHITISNGDSIIVKDDVEDSFMDIEKIDNNIYWGLGVGRSTIFKIEEEKTKILRKFNVGGYVCQKLDSTYLIGGKKGLIEFDLDKDDLIKTVGSAMDHIRSILTIPGGSIYVGSNLGLTEYDHNLNIVRRIVNQSVEEFDQANINDIHVGDDGRIWLATQGNGVVILDTNFNVLKKINKLNGLPNDVIYSINYDGKHYWFPTDYGLAKYDEDIEHITNYFEEDGVSNNEFNRYANLVTENKEVYLGTQNGVMVCKNDLDLHSKNDVKLFVSGVYSNFYKEGVNSKLVQKATQDNKVEVNERSGHARISFGLTDFMSPEDHKYAYRYSKDQDWILQGNNNIIDLIDLSAGVYNLEVKAKSKGGRETKLYNTISIISVPPVYKRWWFILLVSFCVLAVLYFFYKWRLKQLERVQNIRQNISKDLHDEVGGMLTEIAILTDVARNVDQKSNQQEIIEEISHKGRGAISAMSDVIWTIDTGTCTMGDIVTKMNNVMSNLLSPLDITFKVTKENLNNDKVLSLTLKKNIYLIFKESIHNIVKHSNASDVQIKIAQSDKGFYLFIENNKTDREKSPLANWSNGLGLKTMKERASLIGGVLEIEESDKSFSVSLDIEKF